MHNLALAAGKAALALREKQINPEGPLYVRLVGRQPGFVDFLLTLIGVNTTTTFEVFEDKIVYSHGSLSGNVTETIPLSKVSNLICGYFKPVILLVAGIIELILALVCLIAAPPVGVILLIVAAISIVMYHLKKTTLISVIPNSASSIAVVFKRSVIENNNISSEEAAQIVEIINTLVDNANR